MSPQVDRRAFLETSAHPAGAGLTSLRWRSRLVAAESAATGVVTPQIPPSPFAASRDSLRADIVPEWFRDAKFGIRPKEYISEDIRFITKDMSLYAILMAWPGRRITTIGCRKERHFGLETWATSQCSVPRETRNWFRIITA